MVQAGEDLIGLCLISRVKSRSCTVKRAYKSDPTATTTFMASFQVAMLRLIRRACLNLLSYLGHFSSSLDLKKGNEPEAEVQRTVEW